MEEQYEKAKRQEDKPLLKTMLGSDGENDTYSFEEAIEIAINRWDQIGTVEQAAVALCFFILLFHDIHNFIKIMAFLCYFSHNFFHSFFGHSILPSIFLYWQSYGTSI